MHHYNIQNTEEHKGSEDTGSLQGESRQLLVPAFVRDSSLHSVANSVRQHLHACMSTRLEFQTWPGYKLVHSYRHKTSPGGGGVGACYHSTDMALHTATGMVHAPFMTMGHIFTTPTLMVYLHSLPWQASPLWGEEQRVRAWAGTGSIYRHNKI